MDDDELQLTFMMAELSLSDSPRQTKSMIGLPLNSHNSLHQSITPLMTTNGHQKLHLSA
jgi:hypothetical protein